MNSTPFWLFRPSRLAPDEQDAFRPSRLPPDEHDVVSPFRPNRLATDEQEAVAAVRCLSPCTRALAVCMREYAFETPPVYVRLWPYFLLCGCTYVYTI